MTKEPLRTMPEDPLREEPAEKLDRDPRVNPNLMWIFGAALLFLIGAGIYMSMTRDYQGNKLATQPAQPAASDSAVAGGRGPSGQGGGGPGAPDATGRQSPTGRQTTGQQ